MKNKKFNSFYFSKKTDEIFSQKETYYKRQLKLYVEIHQSQWTVLLKNLSQLWVVSSETARIELYTYKWTIFPEVACRLILCM